MGDRFQRNALGWVGACGRHSSVLVFSVTADLPEGLTKMKRSHIRFDCSLLVLASTIAVLAATTGCFGAPFGSLVGPTQHPLVAQYTVSISGAAQVWVEFGPDTNYGRQTSQISTTGSGIDRVQILVAGMQASTLYHMRAHAMWANGDSWVDFDHTFTTGPLPSGSQLEGPLPVISVSHPSQSGSTPSPGVELFSFAKPPTVVTDLNGNILWYCNTGAIPIKLLANGDFIVNTGNDLQELDLTCKVLRDVSYTEVNQSLQANGYDFTIPPNLGLGGGSPFHHDMLVLPNGHWIGLCQIAKDFDNLEGISGTTQVVGDALVDIDPNGNVVWAWNSFDHLDVNRHPYFGLPDWTHSNALVYTADGNLLLSMRAQSWILKIDYSNGTGAGDILWKLGPDGDFTLAGGGDASQWFYSQHYPNLLSTNGSIMTLALYDNGDYRTYSDGEVCGSPSAPNCFSRATMFQVDQDTGLATLLWQNLPGLYSSWGGSIGVLSNGDIEFDNTFPVTTQASQITEVTPGDNPQVVWQMNLAGQWAYRGYRIPSLYPGVTWTQ
jgi:arylsulfate sulfotransferase